MLKGNVKLSHLKLYNEKMERQDHSHHFTRFYFPFSVKFKQLPLRQTTNYILCRQLNRNKEATKLGGPLYSAIINFL